MGKLPLHDLKLVQKTCYKRKTKVFLLKRIKIVGKCAPCENRIHDFQISTLGYENDTLPSVLMRHPTFIVKFLISVLIGSLFTANNPALCLIRKRDDTLSARVFESVRREAKLFGYHAAL